MKLVNYINHKLKDNLLFRVGLLLGAMLLIILREPDLFLHPRLWAEEGSIFYAFARHHSVWEIFTSNHVGYLTLFNNLVSTVQAKFFSVENAATVSTFFAFFIQLIPVYIIAFTIISFWDTPLKKLICAFTVIVVTPHELWLNTTNSHFVFGLITFLIMVTFGNTISNFQKYFFRTLLFVGGLNGPASMFFTPMFLLKAYREKTKEKYIQASVITLCAIIQASVILYSIFFDNKYKRLSVHDIQTTRYHFIIDNFSLVPHNPTFHNHYFTFDLITMIGILIGAFYGYLLLKNIRKIDAFIPMISVAIVSVLSTLGSLNMAGGVRYGYIATCVLPMLFLSASTNKDLKQMRFVALFLLIFCLSANTFFYRDSMKGWAYSKDYPKWKNEVAIWHTDSTYQPKIHPAIIQGDQAWRVKL